jgi:hypothetical protein
VDLEKVLIRAVDHQVDQPLEVFEVTAEEITILDPLLKEAEEEAKRDSETK